MRDGRYEVGPTGISMPYAYAGVLERKVMTGGTRCGQADSKPLS